MRRLSDSMDDAQREQVELDRLRKIGIASETRVRIANRLSYIFKTADPCSAYRGQSDYEDAVAFADQVLDTMFGTAEGHCLAEKLRNDDLAGYVGSVQSSATMVRAVLAGARHPVRGLSHYLCK